MGRQNFHPATKGVWDDNVELLANSQTQGSLLTSRNDLHNKPSERKGIRLCITHAEAESGLAKVALTAFSLERGDYHFLFWVIYDFFWLEWQGQN